MSYGPTSDLSDETSAEISPPDKQYSLGGLRPDVDYTVSLISRSGDLSSEPVTTTFTTGEFTTHLIHSKAVVQREQLENETQVL